uniref:hypothetical protein n=1 Tax=Paracoccus marcusii TaxID=59779 RepID=UPI002491415D
KPIFLAQKGPLPAPDPKDAAIRDLQGDLLRTTHKLEALTNEVKENRKRSRVKAALGSAILVSPDGSGKSDATLAPSGPVNAQPVIVRRRKSPKEAGDEPALQVTDETVNLLVNTVSNVKTIVAQDDGGAAVEAAE